ncbi:MAG: HD domain-containing protein [Armatimonadota bacterium]|nr:HD domain-containing protein [bacterium]
MKKIFVANLREGTRIEDIFLVVSKSVANTRTGSQFLKMTLGDKSGTVDAVKWEATESEISRLHDDEHVLVCATVKTYNDKPQLVIESFQRWGEAVDPADFVRSSPRDPNEMMAELMRLLDQVVNPNLRRLLDIFLVSGDYAVKFRQAPAAKKLHHAYVAGLLEHTLNVVRTCAALADSYPQVDRDLLLTAAALHDIGKTEEYLWSGSIKFSDAGHLVGHVVGGAMAVKEACDQIDGFDPMMNLALQHMIISHHGNKEWGSPKQPKSIEAVMLHCADDLDAKVAMFEDAIRNSDNSGLFTERHFMLERPIFKGLPGNAARAAESDLDQEAFGNTEESDLELFAADVGCDPFVEA